MRAEGLGWGLRVERECVKEKRLKKREKRLFYEKKGSKKSALPGRLPQGPPGAVPAGGCLDRLRRCPTLSISYASGGAAPRAPPARPLRRRLRRGPPGAVPLDLRVPRRLQRAGSAGVGTITNTTTETPKKKKYLLVEDETHHVPRRSTRVYGITEPNFIMIDRT